LTGFFLFDYTGYVLKNCPMKLSRNQKGFTLIELLVVIGILAVLLAITLIAINPARQFAQANNTQRQSDANAILNAVSQYLVDQKGNTAGLTGAGVVVGTATNMSSAVGDANICSLIVDDYIAAMPVDPQQGDWDATLADPCTDYDTQYTIMITAGGRVTVAATAEAISGVTPVISVTR
jgi:prepilin-type N-terminal cleavage/methylation domain-containing protein